MLKPGMQVGDWVVDKPLAEGGMGSVFLCHNRVSERVRVALKVVVSDVEELLRRFDREAEIIARLEHPGIVRYVAHGVDAVHGRYLAMEWLDGESVQDRLKVGPLTVAEAVPVLNARWSSRTIGCQMAMQGRIRQGRMDWSTLRSPCG